MADWGYFDFSLEQRGMTRRLVLPLPVLMVVAVFARCAAAAPPPLAAAQLPGRVLPVYRYNTELNRREFDEVLSLGRKVRAGGHMACSAAVTTAATPGGPASALRGCRRGRPCGRRGQGRAAAGCSDQIDPHVPCEL